MLKTQKGIGRLLTNQEEKALARAWDAFNHIHAFPDGESYFVNYIIYGYHCRNVKISAAKIEFERSLHDIISSAADNRELVIRNWSKAARLKSLFSRANKIQNHLLKETSLSLIFQFMQRYSKYRDDTIAGRLNSHIKAS